MMQTNPPGKGPTLPPTPTPMVERLSDPAFIEPFVLWTARRVPNVEDAEDIVGNARLRALRREARGEHWDPQGDVTAVVYFMKVLKQQLIDWRRLARRRPEVSLEEPDLVASQEASPEEQVAEQLEGDQRRRLANDLHRDLAESGKDPIALGILESYAAGVTGHAEIAARVGCTVDAVRAGIKRLARHARAAVDSSRQPARFQ
jgi:RNA polymerase sigma factor (sigma-70 family)